MVAKKQALQTVALLSFLLLISFSADAQERYKDHIFQDVNRTDGIPYGKAVKNNGDTTILRFDLYEPVGDTAKKRPLIIWIHGGGFISGTRQNGFNLFFAEDFAERGYTCVSIDYRKGLESGNQAYAFGRAIIRAVQDAHAAVRFFRKNAEQYGIDTSYIVMGGSSAGSITAIHAEYWDQDEMPAFLDTSGVGSLEGKSGSPGYSSEFDVVVNCWGAITDTNMMETGDQPIVSVHGVQDQTVPFESGGLLYGSAPIHRMADRLFIENDLKAYPNADHLLLINGVVGDRWETASDFIAAFLYDQLPTSLSTGIYAVPDKKWCYPSLTSGELKISLDNVQAIEVFDTSGRVVKKYSGDNKFININELQDGIYFIRVFSNDKYYVSRILKK